MSEQELNELKERLKKQTAIKKEQEKSQNTVNANTSKENEGEITIQDLKDKKYGREDSKSGYTTSTYETALLKASRKYDIIANELLGRYDDNGEYYISTDVLTELANLKKIVGITNEFGTEVRAPYKDGRSFNFLLKIGEEDPETHTAESVLYLLETVNKVNGYIQNIISTPVATYTYKFDEHYKTYCYRALHIVGIDGEDDGALKPEDAVYIDQRYRYLAAVKKASKDDYLLLEESFFNSRIQILNEIPQGALVLSEFNKKRNALDKYFINNPRNKYRALNELLTSILEAYFEDFENNSAYKISMQILAVKYLNQVAKISEKIKETEDYKKAKEAVQVIVAPAPKTATAGGGGVGTVKVGGKKITAKSPSKAKGAKPAKKKDSKPAKKKDSKPAKKDKGKDNKKAKGGGGGGSKTVKNEIAKIIRGEDLSRTLRTKDLNDKKNKQDTAKPQGNKRVDSTLLK